MESPLYIEISGKWKEVYGILNGKTLKFHEKLRLNLSSSITNCGECILEFDILPEECECKPLTLSLSAITKIVRNNSLSETPYFFTIYITTQNKTYTLGACKEDDRTKWINIIKKLSRPQVRPNTEWIKTSLLNSNNEEVSLSENRFTNTGSTLINGVQSEQAQIDDKSNLDENEILDPSISPYQTIMSNYLTNNKKTKPKIRKVEMVYKRQFSNRQSTVNISKQKSLQNIDKASSSNKPFDVEIEEFDNEDSDDNFWDYFYNLEKRLCGIKNDSFVRLIRVLLSFPFVIVAATINPNSRLSIFTSLFAIRFVNTLIYVVPIILVEFVLSKYLTKTLQTAVVCLYILLFLFPVGLVAFAKIRVTFSTSKIEEGTFCFKPARTVKLSQANFYAMTGFAFDWLQHVLYVIPTGILTSNRRVARLSDFPPFLKFDVYFWTAVAGSFACGLILILNAVLRGKLHYKYQKTNWIWILLYNLSSPMFVSFITVMFMGLSCDYSLSPPTLIQDPTIVCYSNRHKVMVQCALIALSVYILQNTLLPSGTFKETMRGNDLDIMFVPVYLQAFFFLKTIFCGIYVYFYTDNMTRCIVLTIINMLLLLMNAYMKPCSVEWINILRDTIFMHATISGIQSLNYLAWDKDYSTKGLLLSTLSSNILFTTIAIFIYYNITYRSNEYIIAKAFLDLEWQVSRGGSVHPRVLEPLISLTLSNDPLDWIIAKKYIKQLVWLISYPNMRVQFQSIWGLANLALIDDNTRDIIYDNGILKIIFDKYNDMEIINQLETLAILTNLTLSNNLKLIDDMVIRYKCVTFFIQILKLNKNAISQIFCCIALGNLARHEKYRDIIYNNSGINILINSLLSSNYNKRKYSCLTLANILLSTNNTNIIKLFLSNNVIDKIIKIAKRNEIETQREVIALLHNLSCHKKLRSILLNKQILVVINCIAKNTIFLDVKEWCKEINIIMEREISLSNNNTSILNYDDIEYLKKMTPLFGQVEWDTWGSKLENIFYPIVITIPSVYNQYIECSKDSYIAINLSYKISKYMLSIWKDNMIYKIRNRPKYGRLTEYTTSDSTIMYIPQSKYQGQDSFSFYIQVGSLKSWTATVYITIYDERTFYDEDVDETNKDGNKYSRYKNKQDDYIDDDDIEQGHVTDRPSDEFDDDMNDPIDPDEIYDTYPNNDNHSNYKKSFEVKNNYRSRLPSKRSNRSDINSDVN